MRLNMNTSTNSRSRFSGGFEQSTMCRNTTGKITATNSFKKKFLHWVPFLTENLLLQAATYERQRFLVITSYKFGFFRSALPSPSPCHSGGKVLHSPLTFKMSHSPFSCKWVWSRVCVCIKGATPLANDSSQVSVNSRKQEEEMVTADPYCERVNALSVPPQVGVDRALALEHRRHVLMTRCVSD